MCSVTFQAKCALKLKLNCYDNQKIFLLRITLGHSINLQNIIVGYAADGFKNANDNKVII